MIALVLLLAAPLTQARPPILCQRSRIPTRFHVHTSQRHISRVARLRQRAGHGDLAGKFDKSSFVQNDMRKAAMKLHTRDQAKEGEQKTQKPISQWEMSMSSILRFLVDSKVIHDTLDDIAASYSELSTLNDVSTEIRRGRNIEKDITQILHENPELNRPEPGKDALGYAESLRSLAGESVPAFVCHFYNTHFAHAAGGRMIGKLIADKNFNGRTLEFYKYNGEPKELLEDVRKEIDVLATNWDEEGRENCLSETANAFKGAGTVLQNLK
eukprot:CAMPEP_0185274036 /NCGR_PEP_ID=MMETSP1359-20130426/50921_1 /TAXON_ID=552665 /ORGANISM="Bigelowiella longifila, Strain CCMP242" /LENGTH=269 /DNA_ID=CAMNT_0027866863 /DNA_START=1 /DNA_END=810 /DNA_ORIENTATION=-